MLIRPFSFDTPYEVVRPTRFQPLIPQTMDGEQRDSGLLQKGDVVWTHRSLPQVKGHHTALAFLENAGEILIEISSLHRVTDAAGSRPLH